MATILKPRRRLTHKFCPHCCKDINTKTYKEHRRLYFDATSKSWLTVETSNVETYESDSSGSSPFSSTPELTDDGGMYDGFSWDITPDTRAPKALDDHPSHSEGMMYKQISTSSSRHTSYPMLTLEALKGVVILGQANWIISFSSSPACLWLT